MNVDALKVMLRAHEGVRTRPYHDTVGRITVGVGRNLDDKPLKPDEIEYLLDGDVQDVLAECRTFSWFVKLNEVRQLVIADMLFNLGFARFKAFSMTIAALERGDYDLAATNMLQSKWAVQVGQRARDLAQMMRAG